MMIDFKGAHYPKDVIVHAVFFYVRYAVSYHDLEEILAKRGVNIDHATLNHWVCLLYTSPSPRDRSLSRMPSSA